MGTPAITAVGLSKQYRGSRKDQPWIQALRDVSFEIAEGEAVGLIGRNGAGKSTALRILSRVTRPSSGYAEVKGRVGALLEVGTGFHPELTGRENTFLSGAILGMSRRDTAARYDEIVAFAELEPFMDTPVKRYSSGMYARLGFAVAAHLRPSVLIVDEVLAVGDLPFQAKCLALMHRLTHHGTTVLFVSHNLLAVSDLCSRGLVVEDGVLSFDGSASDAVSHYRSSLTDDETRGPSGHLALIVNGQERREELVVDPSDQIRLEVQITRSADARSWPVYVNVLLESPDGRTIMHLRNDQAGAELTLRPGLNRFGISIDELPLAAGAYSLWARVAAIDAEDPLIVDSARTVLKFAGDQRLSGIVSPPHHFEEIRSGLGRHSK